MQQMMLPILRTVDVLDGGRTKERLSANSVVTGRWMSLKAKDRQGVQAPCDRTRLAGFIPVQAGRH